MKVEALGAIGGPTFVTNTSPRTLIVSAYYGRPGSVVRKVRGWKCRDLPSLMSELGAALQLFDGFGENWHALQECLCYLDEWLPGDGYVLVVERAEELLSDDPGELRWFVAVMTDVARWWARPVRDNGRYDRPARPFHVVLEPSPSAESSLARRLEEAGAVATDWSP